MYVPRTVDYGMISSQAARAKTNENLAAMDAQSQVVGAGIAAEANVQQNKLAAEAKQAKAQAEAGASQFGAIMGGLGSLASGFSVFGKGDAQNASDYTNKVDFGGGKSMMANDNGRLYHQNFQFGVPGK